MSNSHIQRNIISRLKNADSLPWSKLKPSNVDRDLFNYHLRQLVESGIIEKLPFRAGYTLSAKGQRRVADIHHTSDQANRLFKINPLLIVIDDHADELHILNQRRTAQPDYGTIGVPGGTILKGEPLLAGATRKLEQETGLSAEFEHIATTRRILYENNELYADVVFPICLAMHYTGTLRTTDFGENFWVPIKQAIANENNRIDYITTVLLALQANTLDTVRGQYYEQITHR